MQKQEPGKGNLKFSDLKVTGMNSMSRKHLKLFGILLVVAAAFNTSASAQDAGKNRPDPLVIQAQGSFAVGGTVVTAPGTFDPIKQGAYNPAGTDPAGQTLHGDHAYVFYQVPVNARKLPLIFRHGHGRIHEGDERVPKLDICTLGEAAQLPGQQRSVSGSDCMKPRTDAIWLFSEMNS